MVLFIASYLLSITLNIHAESLTKFCAFINHISANFCIVFFSANNQSATTPILLITQLFVYLAADIAYAVGFVSLNFSISVSNHICDSSPFSILVVNACLCATSNISCCNHQAYLAAFFSVVKAIDFISSFQFFIKFSSVSQSIAQYHLAANQAFNLTKSFVDRLAKSILYSLATSFNVLLIF